MRLSIAGPVLILAGISVAMAWDVATAHQPTELAAAAVQPNGPRMVNPAGQQTPAWWSDRDAGLIGGIGGGVLGLLGGLIGSLGGCGKARWLVLPLTAILAVLGIASLVTGVIALTLGQPYAVWYPLLLAGLVLSIVMDPMFFLLRWAYQQREFRKMAALDAR